LAVVNNVITAVVRASHWAYCRFGLSYHCVLARHYNIIINYFMHDVGSSYHLSVDAEVHPQTHINIICEAPLGNQDVYVYYNECQRQPSHFSTISSITDTAVNVSFHFCMPSFGFWWLFYTASITYQRFFKTRVTGTIDHNITHFSRCILFSEPVNVFYYVIFLSSR